MRLDQFVRAPVLTTLLTAFSNQHKVRVEIVNLDGSVAASFGDLPFLSQIIQNKDNSLSRENYVSNKDNSRYLCEGGLGVISEPIFHKGEVIGQLVIRGLKLSESPPDYSVLSHQIQVDASELHDEFLQLPLIDKHLVDILTHQLKLLGTTLPALCLSALKNHKKLKTLSSFQKLHDLLSSTTDFEKVIHAILTFLISELPFTHSVVHLLDFQQAFISSPLPGPREEIEAIMARQMGDYSQSVGNVSSDFSFQNLEGISSFQKSVLGFSVVSSDQRIALVFCYGEPDSQLSDVERELLEVLKFRFKDIIIKHLELESAQRSAITDKLTTLFNRRYFNDRLSLELAECQETKDPISLIMVDLDHFKKLNDTFGHQKGDEVLTALGKIIKSVLRRSDIPCRYGGEEFAIILAHTALSDAKMVAERLREAVEKFDFGYIEETQPVTCSVGLATCSNGSVDAHVLLKEADGALYRAKNLGRNRVECSLMVDRNMGTIDVNEADELYVQKGQE